MQRIHMVVGFFIVLALMSFYPNQSAWAAAASQVPDPSILLQANPTASGTKVFGKLSIFYTISSTPNGSCAALASPVVDMHIALQGWTGNVSSSRTAGRTVLGQCYFSTTAQKAIIQNVIQTGLLPKLQLSTFEIKDADNLVQDENGDASLANPWFLMMDFILAAR